MPTVPDKLEFYVYLPTFQNYSNIYVSSTSIHCGHQQLTPSLTSNCFAFPPLFLPSQQVIFPSVRNFVVHTKSLFSLEFPQKSKLYER